MTHGTFLSPYFSKSLTAKTFGGYKWSWSRM